MRPVLWAPVAGLAVLLLVGSAGAVYSGSLTVQAPGSLMGARLVAPGSCVASFSWTAGAATYDNVDLRNEYNDFTIDIVEDGTDACLGKSVSATVYDVGTGAALGQSSAPVVVTDASTDTAASVVLTLDQGVPEGRDQNDAATGLAMVAQ